MINGLGYLENYISEKEEKNLLCLIDKQEWILDLQRRVQHYGFRYDYKNNTINQEPVAPIPEFLQFLCSRLVNDKIFTTQPNQIIINEYLPGHGIRSHIDADCFDNTICSLSLGSNCVMHFTKNEMSRKKLLERRSLLILKQEARYHWQHEILPVKIDNYINDHFPRKKRLSITFRTVLNDNKPHG